MSNGRSLLVVFLAVVASRAASQSIAKKDDQKCVCVQFYLCNIDQKVNIRGEGTLDERLDVCAEDEVCCFLPDGTENGGDGGVRAKEPSTKPVPVPQPVTQPTVVVEPSKNPPALPQVPQGSGCGLRRIVHRPSGLDERISNDQPAQAGYGEFPWMVMLYKRVNNKETYLCGGSIIHPSVVLTAAHCVLEKKDDGQQEIGEVKVRAGEWNTVETYEPIEPEERSVTRIIVHPEFERATLINDLAMLMLDKPIATSEVVDYVCAISEKSLSRINMTRCIVTGWGRDTFQAKNMQTILRFVEMPTVDRDRCQALLRTTRLSEHFQLHESFVCAGGVVGQDSCTGDGGGALVCPVDTDPGRFVQIGIVSWGIGCASEIPGVYVSVPHYFQWINSNIRNALE